MRDCTDTRVIKFRAWDKNEECLMTWEEIMSVKYNMLWYKNNKGKDLVNCLFTDNSYILMQFTGIYDINGKEIYEGDIVIVPGDVYGHKERKAKVIYDEDGCYTLYDTNDGYGIVHQHWYWERVEVIGNIYENHELVD